MGHDERERARRSAVDRAQAGKKQPFAALEHRILDSPAYADLGGSAVKLLLAIARQLNRDNNGHLQATFAWCQRYGINSEHTLQSALADLISHGLLYRTRSRGANRAWARYAVTWLPIKKRDGLFLDGFESCAYRSWTPPKPPLVEKKAPRKKCRIDPAECAVSPPKFLQKVQETDLQKVQCMNHVAMVDMENAWQAPFIKRLRSRGLHGQQCFRLPPVSGVFQ